MQKRRQLDFVKEREILSVQGQEGHRARPVGSRLVPRRTIIDVLRGFRSEEVAA